jgi:outer membrane receptor protein involved in Fe transport
MIGLSAALAMPAMAQVSAPSIAAPGSASSDLPASGDEGIVVTGTRIARDGAAAPTPVTVIGSDYLATRAATNIADVLNEIPSFRGTSTPTTNGTSATTAGGNFIDLRGLGSNRTLLLVDGKRHVPTSITGRVDLNMIPSVLINRVEVVTGGASAVYGSDAVSGVVNLILKDKFEGIEGTVQGDVSELGDAEGYSAEMVAGKSFLDGRLNVTVAGQLYRNNGAGSQYTRDWGRRENFLVTNPTAGNGQPTRIITGDVHSATMTPYGLITSGPLRGTQFDANGSAFPFNYGTLVGSQYMVGGDGEGDNFLHGFWLSPKIRRQLASIQVSYQATDDIELKSEFFYGRSHVTNESVAPFDFGTLTIGRDNAYLPASVAAAMDARGLTSFGFGRFSLDVGANTPDNYTNTYRWVQSARGSLGSWKWDAYYQFGKVDYHAHLRGVRNNANYLAAIDSVIDPATGRAICRSSLTSPSNGCVAYNPFGDQASQESKDYVTGDLWQDVTLKQHVAAANLTGTVADLWAGPLAVSVGGEYRFESAHGTSDALSQANAYAAGNYKPISGSFDVFEGYLEADLPLLRDLPLVRSLDLNGAIRYADYSTSGGATTWKLGGTWEVFDGFRLRATRSRDVRAPNISELFSSAVSRIDSVTDPFRNNSLIFANTVTSGSTALTPEVAKTVTLGASYMAPWLPGLRASVDYYNISIRDAISSLTAQNILDRCYAGDTALCGLVQRGSDGLISQINIAQINIASLKTRGVDFELSYTTPLLGGTLSWRNLATYVDKYEQSNGVVVQQLAGQFSEPGIPHWTGNSTLTYSQDRYSGSLTGRFVGGGKYDNRYVEGVDINDNSVTSRVYLNLSVQYDIWRAQSGEGKIQAFVVVNNLLDKDPSVTPTSTSPTNAAYFDVIGRAYRAGIRFRL